MKPRRYGARGTIPVQQQAGLLDDVTLLDYMGMVSPMLPAALLGDPFSPTEAMANEEQELKKFRDAQSYQAPSIRKSKKTSTKITGSKYTPPKDAFLNLSNMSEIPDVPQKVFDRMEPTKKAIETFEKYATRTTMDRMNQAVDKGLSMGGLEWYNLNPLKQAFIDELGERVTVVCRAIIFSSMASNSASEPKDGAFAASFSNLSTRISLIFSSSSVSRLYPL